MKTRGATTLLAITLGWLVITATGCDCNCDEPASFESGDYLIVEPAYRQLFPGDEWFVGGGLHVDREAQVATIRYTREGTTYEVRYTLAQ
jgi:hypothetical protein